MSETRPQVQHPSRAGVEAAASRVAGVVRTTPLLRIAVGDRAFLVKADSLQHGGAFKLRGAYNRLVQIAEADRARGVVAFSSGNHAQGVARAAQLLNMPALIVMPSDAPAVKLDGTRALGAEILLYDRARTSREELAARVAAERGAALVPSFDDVDVIEGQGTLGLEAQSQADGPIERVVVPCGGGGLAAGIALALPDAELFVVEPQGWDDMGRSLIAGEIVPVGPNPPHTSCDALQTLRVSPLTFDVLRRRRACGVSVDEAEIGLAMRFAFSHGLVVEPGGAAALAAVMAGRVPASARTTMVVLSGSNVDPAAFARVIAA